MTEQEHALLQAIKSAVKSNPEFFGMDWQDTLMEVE